MSDNFQYKLFPIPNKVFISVGEAISEGFLPRANSTHKFSNNLKLIDVRFSLDDPKNYGRNQYLKSHLPNAIFVDLDTELSGDTSQTTARHPLPECSDFIALCVKLGIRGGTTCLVYDDTGGGHAGGRMWWMLDNIGVDVYILDGGMQAYLHYLAEENAKMISTRNILAKDIPQPLKITWPFRKKFSHIVDYDYIRRIYLEKKDPVVPVYLDARFAFRFNSTCRPFCDQLPGHVPGSQNHPWNLDLMPVQNVPPGVSLYNVLRPLHDIKKEYAKLLRDGEKSLSNCIFACASGVTACLCIAVCCHIGLGKPMLYPGSWSEYEGRNKEFLEDEAIKKCGFAIRLTKRINPVGAVRFADVHNSGRYIIKVNGQLWTPDIKCKNEKIIVTAAKSLFIGEEGDVVIYGENKSHDIKFHIKVDLKSAL